MWPAGLPAGSPRDDLAALGRCDQALLDLPIEALLNAIEGLADGGGIDVHELHSPAADGGDLVVLDAGTGDVLASLPLPGEPDVVMHDAERGRLHVAIGDPGVISVFDSGRLEHVETIEAEPGAHTTCWDPLGRCLYVFCPTSCGAALYEDRG